MNNTPEDPQALFAKQIEDEIKERFHPKVKSKFQMETLEDLRILINLSFKPQTQAASQMITNIF